MNRDAKLILKIAAGVVLGLIVWSAGSAALSWMSDRGKKERDREAIEQSRVETEEAVKRMRQESDIQAEWVFILSDAHHEKSGTIRERIHSQPKYKARLAAVGSVAIRDEEFRAINNHLNFLERNPRRDDDPKWKADLVDRMGVILEEKKSSQ
jgi:hypothetical protein